ncbi:MAG TPA: LuxR C-terminal-related transcriptional regulator [Tepidisphaeraceae bacterium]
MVPEHAINPHDLDHLGKLLPHEVTFTKRLIQRLCKPVTIDWPGELHDEVARKLGVDTHGLHTGRISGAFRTHYVRHLAGRRGRPVPLLYTDQPLDPCARHFASADPFWGWTATYLPNSLPDDFETVLTRVPEYPPADARQHNSESTHPEVASPPSRFRAEDPRRLPPPPPDYVWYKWKGDTYVGTSYDRMIEKRTAARARLKAQGRGPKPRPKLMTGSLFFRGWSWLCPQCRRTAKVLYMPMRPLLMQLPVDSCQLPEKKWSVASDQWSVDANLATDHRPLTTPPAPAFACHRCHRVQFFSRARPAVAWNHLISHLSGGLLCGNDVPMPAEFKEPRRKLGPYRPSITRAPSRWREPVMKLLLEGLDYREISRRLGITTKSIANHAHNIYQQHNVHGRRQLARKLGICLPQQQRDLAVRAQILQLLLAGGNNTTISKQMKLTVPQIRNHMGHIYRDEGVCGRRELLEKFRHASQATRLNVEQPDRSRI